ncbi:MAG TPA: hypothetical protein PKA33_01535 [Amaricoccus sp.]|mgnify:CR=1 FL=1|uniref:hypothetical protein n=1 Tax=Amaricoccus sp. TaxID=1872485 RepID=UPI002CCA7755|nr:hypothetical protein [Amaricoccus sp.]HMR51223.1 hypothetical protein [Amaricoccus sp.]HMT98028.1 hypothetical protein [Amaricoccus sp.]
MTGAARLEVEVIYQTTRGRQHCIRETEDGRDIWIPVSETEITRRRAPRLFDTSLPARGEIITVAAPEWLLMEKGLI